MTKSSAWKRDINKAKGHKAKARSIEVIGQGQGLIEKAKVVQLMPEKKTT